jgi:hypothetical protein
MISSSPDSHTKRKENLEQTQINQPSTTHLKSTATPSKHTTAPPLATHSLVHTEVCLFVYWFVSLSVSIEGANFEIIERASRTDSIV